MVSEGSVHRHLALNLWACMRQYIMVVGVCYTGCLPHGAQEAERVTEGQVTAPQQPIPQ
jgi:hypothetical protein